MCAKPVNLIGGGGHAKVIVAALQAENKNICAIWDDDEAKIGTRILGVPVLGTLSGIKLSDHESFVVAVGPNRTREEISKKFAQAIWETVVHPTAWVHSSVKIGPGSVIMAGAVIQPGAKIGAHVIVNTGTTVDHDCVIKDYVHIGPGSNLAGMVHIDEGAFLGAGSTVIPAKRIGHWSVIGAGAVVVNDIPSDATAVGVPSKVIR